MKNGCGKPADATNPIANEIKWPVYVLTVLSKVIRVGLAGTAVTVLNRRHRAPTRGEGDFEAVVTLMSSSVMGCVRMYGDTVR